ncbi:hypothetical protein BDK51DRAFT_28604 [Blyttiomyces helicus]|uniref:RRM domain-containing protein n=1 Tax=Blyttiomyces helicus TaxID=388810 RepID=A0A4P9WE19_9FUNG|nr:hypothetical protein BDK51DRAFT_28604 [Blyttiomyces helicus]|eukprot:RKO90959.1 hypothetical protein BDK51DRAFT_28604 [Blyttiomyces helicus]
MSGPGPSGNGAALFIGRLPADVRSRDLEDVFFKFGRILRCDIKRGQADSRPLVVLGTRVVVEYAKGGGRRSGENECFKDWESNAVATATGLVTAVKEAMADATADETATMAAGGAAPLLAVEAPAAPNAGI